MFFLREGEAVFWGMSAAEERRWLLKALPYAQDAVSDLSQMFTEDMPFYVSRDPLTQTQVHADSIILNGYDARVFLPSPPLILLLWWTHPSPLSSDRTS